MRRTLGRLFRPNAEPLLPNWRHMPIAYHGRSSTVVIDGTPIVRPNGQRKPPGSRRAGLWADAAPRHRARGRLRYRPGQSARASRFQPAQAREHIFGLVLVNDWSARDIQAWEYQPLGPFLGKSFATTISPWIVTLDALEPFRAAARRRIRNRFRTCAGPSARRVRHQACSRSLNRSDARRAGIAPVNDRAHELQRALLEHGAAARARDRQRHADAAGRSLRVGNDQRQCTPDSLGSLIELTWNATKPIASAAAAKCVASLQDGDEITLRGWCEQGEFRIGFGSARGSVYHARLRATLG